jgi:amidase
MDRALPAPFLSSYGTMAVPIRPRANIKSMRRRDLILAAGSTALWQSTSKLAAGVPSSAITVASFELDEIPLSELVAGVAQGRWTSERLTELYLARIAAIDRAGPRLNAVIELQPRALEFARTLDQERQAGKVRGALHGIPILVKDNIETGDGMATSAGSLALANWRSPDDAFVIRQLRAAGALILGKTNLSEWANFRSTHSISGWSGRGGQTLNPYALDRTPSGSSSGSGAAAAASLCAAAVGSETDGSITGPASFNGLVGLKPTLGLISRSGIIPLSHSQDTSGPMARTVRDVALLLGGMTGVDAADATTLPSQGHASTDYTRFLDPAGLKGARLGIARKFFADSAPLDRYLSECIAALRDAGAVIVDPADLPSHGKLADPETEVLLYDFKNDLNKYLARLPADAPARTLEALIQFNEQHRAEEMPYFEQEQFVLAQAKGPLTDAGYRKARADCLRLSRTEGIDAVINKHHLDAIVTLTAGAPWLIDRVNGDFDTGGCTTPAAVAGYPHISVPSGLYRGLPIGLSFFASAWSEPTLLKLAYAWEQATQARRRPTFVTSDTF